MDFGAAVVAVLITWGVLAFYLIVLVLVLAVIAFIGMIALEGFRKIEDDG